MLHRDRSANEWLQTQTAAAEVDQRTVFTTATNACFSRIPVQMARKYSRGFLKLSMGEKKVNYIRLLKVARYPGLKFVPLQIKVTADKGKF